MSYLESDAERRRRKYAQKYSRAMATAAERPHEYVSRFHCLECARTYFREYKREAYAIRRAIRD